MERGVCPGLVQDEPIRGARWKRESDRLHRVHPERDPEEGYQVRTDQ